MFLAFLDPKASQALFQDLRVDQDATVPLEQILRSQAPVARSDHKDQKGTSARAAEMGRTRLFRGRKATKASQVATVRIQPCQGPKVSRARIRL